MSAADDAPVSVAEAARLFADFSNVPVIVLAVSGGPDSTALMLLAARWRARRKQGPKIVAVTVDHRLRPEAAREAEAVAKLARRLGVTHRTLRWGGRKPVSGLQEAAREARYRLLGKAASAMRAHHILTAHTLDDQAETVLFRMTRGSGITGLAGMARKVERGDMLLVRPLIDLPKTRLIATLRAAGVPFADDPSNSDPRFARTRLRALLPGLAHEGLDARRLALLARRAARADMAIEVVTAVAADRLVAPRRSSRAPIVIDRTGFGSLPDEIAVRLLGRAVDGLGNEGRVELGKLEALFMALKEAGRGAGGLRRTLAGAMVTLEKSAILIERAPPRGGEGGKKRHGRGIAARSGKSLRQRRGRASGGQKVT